jgi:hypothetical protein
MENSEHFNCYPNTDFTFTYTVNRHKGKKNILLYFVQYFSLVETYLINYYIMLYNNINFNMI